MKLHDGHVFVSSSNLFSHTTSCQVKLAAAGVTLPKLLLHQKDLSVGHLH